MSNTQSSALNRYLGIYGALWRNSVIREMQFKTNFVLWIIVELLWFALQLTFITVIYSHTDHIGDWTQWQVILLIGTSNFIQQLFTAFFLSNLVQLSELIRTGRLDFMLLLPINTRFVISLRQIDLGGFVNAGFALSVIFYAGHHLHLSVTVAQILGRLHDQTVMRRAVAAVECGHGAFRQFRNELDGRGKLPRH